MNLTKAEVMSLNDLEAFYNLVGDTFYRFSTVLESLNEEACDSLVRKGYALCKMEDLDAAMKSIQELGDNVMASAAKAVMEFLPSQTGTVKTYQITSAGINALNEYRLEVKFENWKKGL